MLNKGNYKDFLLVDTEGRIIWADIGNPQYFKVGLTSITGLNLRDIYSDIDNDYPLLQVMESRSLFLLLATDSLSRMAFLFITEPVAGVLATAFLKMLILSELLSLFINRVEYRSKDDPDNQAYSCREA